MLLLLLDWMSQAVHLVMLLLLLEWMSQAVRLAHCWTAVNEQLLLQREIGFDHCWKRAVCVCFCEGECEGGLSNLTCPRYVSLLTLCYAVGLRTHQSQSHPGACGPINHSLILGPAYPSVTVSSWGLWTHQSQSHPGACVAPLVPSALQSTHWLHRRGTLSIYSTAAVSLCVHKNRFWKCRKTDHFGDRWFY